MTGRHSFKKLFNNFTSDEKNLIKSQTQQLVEKIEHEKLQQTPAPSLAPKPIKPEFQPAK